MALKYGRPIEAKARLRPVEAKPAAQAGAGPDALDLAEGGQRFDLLLIGAATSEHIDLEEIAALRQAME